MNRRQFTLMTASPLALAACSALPEASRAVERTAAPAAAPAPAPEARKNAGFDTWRARFLTRARARGIPEGVLEKAKKTMVYLPSVLENDKKQFQFRRTLEDYIAVAASPERLRIGAEKTRKHKALLNRIEARYGVEAEVVAAIWGMESSFGARRGNTPVLAALATLGFGSRRAAFFESELIAALRILAAGDISAPRMLGSWAGAMGHTQFIPSTYLAHAADFDGDGRRDIWSDDPGDALASAANYLKQSGWKHGALWGLEVKVPGGEAPLTTKPISEWRALGLTRAIGGRLPDHGPAELILPGGAGGPAFLLFHNYKVLRRYNNSLKYALAVGHLSDRLAGGGLLVGSFGEDANGLTLAERRDLQERLTRAGFDAGGNDGVIGDKTTAAIRAYEAARGLPVTGIASQRLLNHLRG
ncbi:MAG: murein transglycosylase [Rhodobacterales bacterium]|nr:MAG: murein transglycosylase [Rhodobacterales bacterium]